MSVAMHHVKGKLTLGPFPYCEVWIVTGNPLPPPSPSWTGWPSPAVHDDWMQKVNQGPWIEPESFLRNSAARLVKLHDPTRRSQ